MKWKKILAQSVYILVFTALLATNKAMSQDNSVSPDVASIVKMKLAEGQAKLTSLGYEICAAQGKKEDWFNESQKKCVTVKFDKKSTEITEVIVNPAVSECQKGLEASRKIWGKYHDGQSPVNAPKIDEERKKLTEQGFKASYWIDEISPGRISEYWINETSQKAMLIVWEIQGNKWAMTNKTDYKYGKNPAPKK